MRTITAPCTPTLLRQTKTQWRKEGRGIRKGEEPVAYVMRYGKSYGLYERSQTTQQKPYTVARNHLVDLFVGYPDRIGYTDKETGQVFTLQTSSLIGTATQLVSRGFNYGACSRGIRIGKLTAESFHIRTGDTTNWFVIDLDNHDPTLKSTNAHLELVAKLHSRLPELNKLLGIKSTFYQYRQIEPTGIQLWVVLKHDWQRKQLHKLVRVFLMSLGADLDDLLLSSGLAGLDQIEIQPTSHLISMIGCYGKEVFTSRRLRIEDKRFDCIGLSDHIRLGKQAGNVLARYSELVRVREMPSNQPCTRSTPTPSTSTSAPTDHSDRRSWSDLKSLALNGVQQADLLHDSSLEPLAQALLLRENYSCSDREHLTFIALRDWIIHKHNNLVSRITEGKIRLVERQIRSTIKRVLKKPHSGIEVHYAEMRRRDQQFPHRVERLVPLMQQQRNAGPLLEIDCKAGVSPHSQRTQGPATQVLTSRKRLSGNVCKRINDYVKAMVRKGTMAKRLKRFMTRFIKEIGPKGKKYINESRLHELAGNKPGSDPTYLRTWKQHLVKAGMLKTGWHKAIIRNQRCSRYELTDWVVKELGGNPPEAPNLPQEAKMVAKATEQSLRPRKPGSGQMPPLIRTDGPVGRAIAPHSDQFSRPKAASSTYELWTSSGSFR